MLARKKPSVKAAGVLLIFTLLMGVRSAVWAGEDPGISLVLLLDFSQPPAQAQASDLRSESAALLVQLLNDQDYLGLVMSGEPPGVVLPPARLTPEHRAQVREVLAAAKPQPRRQSFPEVVQAALALFPPQSPEPRVLFILTDGSWEGELQKKDGQGAGPESMAAQVRTAGVQVFSVSVSGAAASPELQTLASASGGRVWPINTVSDLPLAVLNFYQYLVQPQEAPLTGTAFRLDPWVKRAVVAAARSSPGKGVTLAAPSGARLTPGTRTPNTCWSAGQVYDLITLSRPQTGLWHLTGARPEATRVFLDTEVTLTLGGTPREVGEDEALRVIAALTGNKVDPATVLMSASTEFRAELRVSDFYPVTANLEVPEPDAASALPPGARVAWFDPLHREGEGTLKVLALGKHFQRLVSLPITISKPWYRPVQPHSEASKALSVRFQPDPGRRAEQVQGTITLHSAQGSLAGALIKLPPGSEIVLDLPTGCPDPCLADLHLTGVAPGGRPLVLSAGPQRLEPFRTLPDKPPQLEATPASQDKVLAPKPSSPALKSKRRWLPFVLTGLGLTILLASVLLLWRERSGEDSEGEAEAGGTPGKKVLRLQAQVEALTKEKAQLQAALEEKTHQIQELLADKADLQADLERLRAKSQGNTKYLEELEKKLEEAEREAQGVQQEYMALYARNQQEKETFKKG